MFNGQAPGPGSRFRGVGLKPSSPKALKPKALKPYTMNPQLRRFRAKGPNRLFSSIAFDQAQLRAMVPSTLFLVFSKQEGRSRSKPEP